jgi:hypothetical protein
MNKYLPNSSELRVAVFTAIATILLVIVGGWVVRGIWWTSMSGFGGGYSMGNMSEGPNPNYFQS